LIKSGKFKPFGPLSLRFEDYSPKYYFSESSDLTLFLFCLNSFQSFIAKKEFKVNLNQLYIEYQFFKLEAPIIIYMEVKIL